MHFYENHNEFPLKFPILSVLPLDSQCLLLTELIPCNDNTTKQKKKKGNLLGSENKICSLRLVHAIYLLGINSFHIVCQHHKRC